MLQQHNINHTAQSLLHFIRSAIEGREYAKFVFSRSLSDAMECFVALGEQHGFSRDDMAFANIGIIHQFVSGGLDISAALKQAIDEGKQQFAVTQQIKLPTLLFSEQQVDEFTVNETTPSFITQQTVTGAVCADYNNTSLSGKIVLITNADPGFDWLFSHNIKGFVTAFGGCNSHMAIRAAELNIPAVIGAGEHKFAQWQQAAHLTIDCASQTVKMT
jgi:phosphoenolpyruvate-protein kinase (PTS system EI component)